MAELSFEEAKQQLVALVERFASNEGHYLNSAYNEETTRNEFINPLFELLGWDVANKQGLAEQYKDCAHEEGIKVDGGLKAPDYSFRIGGQRKFFVEAKKPSVDVRSDTAAAFQLRRYAWSAKLSISILTNFRTTAIYDARPKPSEKDKAGVARVLVIHHTELVDRFDELRAILSKTAVLKGSFDKFADATKTKKGTLEVDDAFLGEIELWRDQLARNIALRNQNIDVDELNFAVQTTIDRIVFSPHCRS